MKIGIMQPYFFPYMGYWQLLNEVDKYVIFDDVNFINRGWINRNRILVEGVPKYFNISMVGASQNKKINEIQIDLNPKLVTKKMRTIEYAYKKAPYFEQVFPMVESILRFANNNLAVYIENSIYTICDYLNINTEIIISSSLNKNNELKGKEKILNICNILGATEYYNAFGGRKLYSYEEFKKKGIKLKFLKSDNIIYKQLDNKFQADLSIIDIIMFNSKEYIINELLHKFIIIDE